MKMRKKAEVSQQNRVRAGQRIAEDGRANGEAPSSTDASQTKAEGLIPGVSVASLRGILPKPLFEMNNWQGMGMGNGDGGQNGE